MYISYTVITVMFSTVIAFSILVDSVRNLHYTPGQLIATNLLELLLYEVELKIKVSTKQKLAPILPTKCKVLMKSMNQVEDKALAITKKCLYRSKLYTIHQQS